MLISTGAGGELFHTAAGTAFADLLIDGHRETWAIRGKQFRAWLRHRFYVEAGTAASAEAIRSALDLLEARAQFEGPTRSLRFLASRAPPRRPSRSSSRRSSIPMRPRCAVRRARNAS